MFITKLWNPRLANCNLSSLFNLFLLSSSICFHRHWLKFYQKVRIINGLSPQFYLVPLLGKKHRHATLPTVKNTRERLPRWSYLRYNFLCWMQYTVLLICFSNEEAVPKFRSDINTFSPGTNISIYRLACLLLTSSETTEISHYKWTLERKLLSALRWDKNTFL